MTRLLFVTFSSLLAISVLPLMLATDIPLVIRAYAHFVGAETKTIDNYKILFLLSPSKPIVGESAYKHKAGTHLAAILQNPSAYEILEPRLVGNRRKIVFGELAGKNGAAYLLSLLGLRKLRRCCKS